MMKTLYRLMADKSAATAIEYGMLTALISVGMLVGLSQFSTSLDDMLIYIRDTITDVRED